MPEDRAGTTTEVEPKRDLSDRRYVLEKPCDECPFRRGGPLGGAHPFRYIGQAHAQMFLPCHKDPAYGANRNNPELVQCAGAAIFRANISRDDHPDSLLKLPGGHPDVYADPKELLCTTMDISPETAENVLSEFSPAVLAANELAQGKIMAMRKRGVVVDG